MKFTFRILPLLLLTLPIALAQAQNAETVKKTDKVHLVGHEDDLLLKRIEDAIADWDPRQLQSPYLKEISDGNTEIKDADGKIIGRHPRYSLRRPDLAEFIADPDAAVALGKALFWDMQSGSDSSPKTQSDPTKSHGMACASCHYRFGADARDRNTTAIAYQAWKLFADERALTASGTPPFDQRSEVFAPKGDTPLDPGTWTQDKSTHTHDIVGSQGIILKEYKGLNADGTEASAPIKRPDWGHARVDMFAVGGMVDDTGANRTRQVTQRNSPSIINAVFNDRQFHDGRAESTFNGFSVFGDFDKRTVLKKAAPDQNGQLVTTPVSVAIVNASLASQAVGPIVNEVEMSYLGRNFHDLAVKLLDRAPLANQNIAPRDSVLAPEVAQGGQGLKATYRTLIQRAFRREWWDDLSNPLSAASDAFKKLLGKLGDPHKDLVTTIASHLPKTPRRGPVTKIQRVIQAKYVGKPIPTEIADLINAAKRWELVENTVFPLSEYAPIDRSIIDNALFGMPSNGHPAPNEDLMVNNFSLYWGLAIMLYESTLISNNSPFDQMMRGDASGVEAVFNAQVGQTMTGVITAKPNPDTDALAPKQIADPAEPLGDDSIRRAQLDKLITKNASPVLTGPAMFQRGFRVFMLNCAECHEPPFFTSAANFDLGPELPEPIAKIHAHALVRPALADAFKQRLLEEKEPAGTGVTEQNRNKLGNRRFFFDEDRLPELEAILQELMIENMGIPDKRPISFNTLPAFPGAAAPDRVPMITWMNFNPIEGTRLPLGFDPSPNPLEKPIDPYAFYDVGFYNVGLSEPRYDWGIWKFAMSPLYENSQGLGAMENRSGTKEEAYQRAKNMEAAGGGSLGSAYALPKKFDPAPKKALPDAPAGSAPPEDHSQEREFLGDDEDRAGMHFFKRGRRLVMTEQTWGHRKPFINDNELMGWGAFKAPSLRNVALTEPYMHNGRFLTLRQVLRFYSFDNPDLIPANQQLNPDLHPEIGRLLINSDGLVTGLPTVPLNLTQIQDSESLLFFLHCLTDQRVRMESGPFDHPSINIPNGFKDNDPSKEIIVPISAVGTDPTQPNPAPAEFPSGS